MKERFRAVLLPPAEVGRVSTVLTFTDILFGFVISELFLRLQKWLQLAWYIRLHLIVGAALVLGSWIGFRRSLHRTEYELKFFNLPIFRFIADQVMILLYFRIAVLTPSDGTQLPAADNLAKSTSLLLVFVFVLYAVWDLLGICMAKAQVHAGNGKRPKYPKVNENGKPTDMEQSPNWIGFGITVGILVLLAALWGVTYGAELNDTQAVWVFSLAVVLLLAYRMLKEIRTSWQLL